MWSAAKRVKTCRTSARREKTCNRCQVRVNMQPASSAENHTTSVKRGKTCNQHQARENMQPASSAEKHATSVKRGQTCNRCQARENIQPASVRQARGNMWLMLSAGKVNETVRMTRSRRQTRENWQSVAIERQQATWLEPVLSDTQKRCDIWEAWGDVQGVKMLSLIKPRIKRPKLCL